MTPQLLGTKVYKEYAVKDVVDYIDWNPFFQVGVGKDHALPCDALPCPVPPCIMLTACLAFSPTHSWMHSPTSHLLACLLLTHALTLLLTSSAVLLLRAPDVYTGCTVHVSTDLQLLSVAYAE